MGIFVDVRSRSPAWRTLLVILAMLVASVPGGLMNRLRGGWMPGGESHGSFGTNPSWKWLTHDGEYRMVMAGGTALMVALASRRIKRGVGLLLFFTIVTYFTLFIGWGCYFSIGKNLHPEKSRVGVFDWLVGHGEAGWTHWRRWARDIVGMSIRGVAWTAPTGIVMFGYGYGWLPMLSGIVMGPMYWMCQIIPSHLKNFGEGTALAEFLWGCWIWLSLMAPMLAFHRSAAQRRSSREEWSTPLALTKPMRIAFTAFLVIFEAIFVLSCISYAQVQQKDPTNKTQTLLGMFVSTLALIGIHAAMLPRKCRTGSVSGTYDTDYRGILDEEDRAISSGLGAGYGSYVSPFESTAEVGEGRVNSWSDMRLFEPGSIPISESAEGVVKVINALLCVPADSPESDADVIAPAVGTHVVPSGWIVFTMSAIVLLWTIVWIPLTVYVALVDNHYFGNPPGFHDWRAAASTMDQ